MSTDNLRSLLKLKKTKDFPAFAQFLTVLERQGPAALKIDEIRNPKHLAFRLGITGPPGAGKSTLISELIQEFRKKKLSIGVLAVDPSSPFTYGALLGDRIRYAEALKDESVFVRSIGSRGSPGGMSASSYLLVRGFDVWEFDILIIETVGVGQTELEVANIADQVSVVLVPESGDGIQMMKAGLMEIANYFIINKSDRPGANSLANELKEAMNFNGDLPKADVFMTVATEKKGVAEFAGKIYQHILSEEIYKTRFSLSRIQSEARAYLRHQNNIKIESQVRKIKSSTDLAKLF